MIAVVAERVRIIIDTDEELRLAVKLAATRADVSVSEFVNSILRRELSHELKVAKEYMPKKRPHAS